MAVQFANSLEELPVWEAPHGFAAWQPRLRDVTGQRVFTYGLLLPQLGSITTADGARRVAERWGLEELAALAARLRREENDPRPLELTRIAQALTAGEAVSDAELDGALADFARTDGRDLASWLGIIETLELVEEPRSPSRKLAGGLLGGFIRELDRAASAGERLNSSGLEYLLPALYRDLEVRRGARWVYDREGRRLRAPQYADLAERAALELDHLLARRPRLGRCRLCERVFVPTRTSRPERQCRAFLWQERPPQRLLERCVPLAAERERTRKRLDQRRRRALRKHGDNQRHPEVDRARKAYAEWLKQNPASPRGRRSAAAPDFVAERSHEQEEE